MSLTISLVNKNEPGKTFITTNLAITLSRLGAKVLLVDLNPQADLTSNFSIKESRFTSYHAMVEVGEFAITQLGNNLDLIPSVVDLIGCELELVIHKDKEHKLQNFLWQFQDQYDFIIIDTPPGIGLLSVNAVVASDLCLLPIKPEEKMHAPYEGLIKSINMVNLLLKEKPLQFYFMFNLCGSNMPLKELKASLSSIYDVLFIGTNISANYPASEALKDMKAAEMNPVEYYKPPSEFKALALEIINLKNHIQ